MQLKEKAGNRDLIKVEKKLRRKLKKKEKVVAAGYQHKRKSSVFDFINKKLGSDGTFVYIFLYFNNLLICIHCCNAIVYSCRKCK